MTDDAANANVAIGEQVVGKVSEKIAWANSAICQQLYVDAVLHVQMQLIDIGDVKAGLQLQTSHRKIAVLRNQTFFKRFVDINNFMLWTVIA